MQNYKLIFIRASLIVVKRKNMGVKPPKPQVNKIQVVGFPSHFQLKSNFSHRYTTDDIMAELAEIRVPLEDFNVHQVAFKLSN